MGAQYLVNIVGKHDVKLAAGRRKRSDVDVEREGDPETQKSRVDHETIGKCQRAQDETGRRLVKHWVLENSAQLPRRVCGLFAGDYSPGGLFTGGTTHLAAVHQTQSYNGA